MDDARIKAQATDNAWKATTYILATLLALSMVVNGIVGWRIVVTATGVGATGASRGGYPSGGGILSATSAVGQPPGPPSPIVDVSADDAPILGSSVAKVEVIAFLDYECSFCAGWHRDSFAHLQKDYISTDKVRFATRNYPLAMHPRARAAAVAANCVRALADDNTYYRYQDVLFANGDLAGATLERQAIQLGIEKNAFRRCTGDADGVMAKKIDQDMADGAAAGVVGTPTFFVNRRMLVGAQPYGVFKATIEAELKRIGVRVERA